MKTEDVVRMAKEAGLAEAAQTPLKDLLRAVPKDGVAMYEEDKFCHHNIPYGRLVHEALSEIERLERFAALVRAEALAEPVKQEPVISPIMTKQEVKELSKKMWDELQDTAFAENTPKYWTYMVNNTWRNIDEQQPPEDAYDEGSLEPLYAAPVDAKSIREQALEEAAKVCDSVNNYDNPMTATDCAAAIRSLCQKTDKGGLK